MRRLHATGPRERHVAGGEYRLPDGGREHWSIHEVGEGAHFVRVDRDGRQEMRVRPDGAAFRLPIRAGPPTVKFSI